MVSKVHDLEPQRPRSAGSLSNGSHSLSGSVILATSPKAMTSPKASKSDPMLASSAPKAEEEDATSPKRRKSISLIQTHSSQPNLRPSFEAEVAKLAALPDDEDDDGGIEAALLKLEGRFEKRSPSRSPVKEEFEKETPLEDWLPGEREGHRKQRHHHEHVEDVHPVQPLPPENVQSRSIHKFSQSTYRTHTQKPSQSVMSEDSYSSIPLLERGLSDAGIRTRKLARVIIKPDSDDEGGEPHHKGGPVHSPTSSIEHVVETDSMRRIPRGETMPRSPTMHESFLLDDNQDLSDVSNVDHSDTGSQGVRSFFDDEAIEDEPNTEIFTHPLRHPDTPPAQMLPVMNTLQNGSTTFNQGLPTPGLTPTAKTPAPTAPSPTPDSRPAASAPEIPRWAKPTPGATPAGAHLPFILAYDAETLAQQFTVIEKDALDEIDWRELIELRWKQTSPGVRDWVEYLLTQEPRGVDLVIARFNLVVKWVKSEMVLCDSLEERVRCACQFIHIAEYCRRLHNYATMYQITIALLSTDCARLKKTWEYVPDNETQVLKELEKVVQPLKNFHNLRVEMETGTGEEGCIPFIGIYTRDLVYNAQKPAFVTSPPYNAEDPLVNFERHHTAATIVKSLLRLLEASSKYHFQVDPVIASRCLWLGTLSDEEITSRSKRLE
jgi:RasGEF domain